MPLVASNFAYSWTLNGTPIAGAVSNSIIATTPGSYVCQVRAANQAGSTQKSSPAQVVVAGPHTVTVTSDGAGSGTVTNSPGERLEVRELGGRVCGGQFMQRVDDHRSDRHRDVPLLVPNTKITKATISSKQHTATFRFGVVGTPSGFSCALVKNPKRHHKHAKPTYRPCRSPKLYRHLKAERYTFSVRGSNAGGSDPTPATKRFTIS